MSFHKLPLSLLVFLTLATTIFHHSDAQNSATDFVNTHNTVRASDGVTGITWNTTIAVYASNYANARILDCSLIISGGPYGESLAKGSASFTGIQAVNLWASEKSFYNYPSNTCASGKVCSHYTQVVWQASLQVGCARVTCNNGQVFVTCNYALPGNVPGQHPY